MPRQSRKKSSTGIYHVMLRGINKQDIYEEAEDYVRMKNSHGGNAWFARHFRWVPSDEPGDVLWFTVMIQPASMTTTATEP